MTIFGAEPFSGGWQTVLDVLRVVNMATGFVVAILAARIIGNPWKRRYGPQTRPGAVALMLFAVSASLTSMGRLGHDMGYWRLPVNLIGLAFAAVTCWMLAKVPTLTYPDLESPDKRRIRELEQMLDEAQEAALRREK